MRICLGCGEALGGSGWNCPVCGWAPEATKGVLVFSPSHDGAHPSYPEGYHNEIHALEAAHFWFRGRNRLVLWALRRHFSDMSRFLEIGCGTGFVLGAVQNAFPAVEVSGSEISLEGLPYAASRAPGAFVFQMDAQRIPFRDHFDVIGAFDVIEHIEDDLGVLKEMAAALRPGGGVLLSVPQHRWLWSPVDTFAGHFRRYRRRDLVAKLRMAGFEPMTTTSFVSLLLPVMALSRLLKRGGGDPEPELRAGRLENTLGSMVSWLELNLIRLGLRFPAGGSLLIAARKSEEAA